jgi:hypothetical protein
MKKGNPDAKNGSAESEDTRSNPYFGLEPNLKVCQGKDAMGERRRRVPKPASQEVEGGPEKACIGEPGKAMR